MINIHVVPHEIGVAIAPNGNPLVTGFDKQAGIMFSIEVGSAYWKKFIESAGRLHGVGIAPATLDDIAAVSLERHGQNGG